MGIKRTLSSRLSAPIAQLNRATAFIQYDELQIISTK